MTDSRNLALTINVLLATLPVRLPTKRVQRVLLSPSSPTLSRHSGPGAEWPDFSEARYIMKIYLNPVSKKNILIIVTAISQAVFHSQITSLFDIYYLLDCETRKSYFLDFILLNRNRTQVTLHIESLPMKTGREMSPNPPEFALASSPPLLFFCKPILMDVPRISGVSLDRTDTNKNNTKRVAS